MRIDETAKPIARPVGVMLFLGALAQLAGCAADRPDAAGVATVRGATAGAAAAQAPDIEPAYLRLDPEKTGMEAVQDDGRLTYLTFAVPPAADLGFFNQDGRPLANARAGRVVAVAGIHRGILVRGARDRASFVTPNPRRPASPRHVPPETADHIEARAALENQSMLQQAMQHALAAVAPAGSAPTPANATTHATHATNTTPIPPATPAPAPQGMAADASGGGAPASPERRHAERFAATVPLLPVAQLAPAGPPVDARGTALPEVTYLDASSPGSRPVVGSRWPSEPGRHALPVPLAAAHASVAVPAHGLVRVFFATASRTIVAPDDGLGLLLREAPHADEIRVTGFTDATGSRETNDALARARADAVVQILMRRGVAPERIFSGGIGAADYIADNATEKGRALNRRVEVVLLRGGRPLAFGGPTARD